MFYIKPQHESCLLCVTVRRLNWAHCVLLHRRPSFGGTICCCCTAFPRVVKINPRKRLWSRASSTNILSHDRVCRKNQTISISTAVWWCVWWLGALQCDTAEYFQSLSINSQHIRKITRIDRATIDGGVRTTEPSRSDQLAALSEWQTADPFRIFLRTTRYASAFSQGARSDWDA